MALDPTSQTEEIQELIQRARALRQKFRMSAALVDMQGGYPYENFQQIWQAGLYQLNIPQTYGGLNNEKVNANIESTMEVITHLSAGESSTGMIFMIYVSTLRRFLDEHNGLSEATRQQVAREVLEENARIIAPHSDTGTGGVTSRKVDGGIVITGVKPFNSGSDGARYAGVLHTLEGTPGMHFGLARLDDPGVRLHLDWDNMGMRATASQTITYQDVFIPDGWHYHLSQLPPLFFPFIFLAHAAVMLGIGQGGFDAMLEYLHRVNRSITPGWNNGTTDPLVRLRVGDLSTRLAAAHALLCQVSRRVEQMDKEPDPQSLLVDVLRAKAACVDAALKTTGEMFELTGTRSTANTYRLDRFWRDARTFSLHDSTDAKLVMIGGYELTGEFQMFGPPQIKV